MRRAIVYFKKEPAGELIQEDSGSFIFRYASYWISSDAKPAISLTLPKSQREYKAKSLFPFFYNMLPEGTNRQAVCFQNRIDSEDDFGLLLSTANIDAIGAVTVASVHEFPD